MDQSKKNAILFAAIFSILAVSVGLFIIFKPFSRSVSKTNTVSVGEENSIPATSNTSPVSTVSPKTQTTSKPPESAQTPSFFSSFLSALKQFLTPGLKQNSGISNMFGAPSSQNGTVGASKSGSGNNSSGASPNLTPEEQQQQYQKQLEDIQNQLKQANQTAAKISNDLNSSPFKGTVSISSVSLAGSGSLNNEIVVLQTNQYFPKQTKITGWVLKSVPTGQTVNIDKQVVYLPQTNIVNTEEDLVVNPNTTLIISSGQPPTSYSFRENKCTGYFSQFQSFNPGLAQRCPAIVNEQWPPAPNNFDDVCIDYLNAFPICRIHYNPAAASNPTAQKNDRYYQITHECQIFVDNTSGYANCVRLHEHDSDFFNSTWRIYLGRSQTAWKSRREIIQLLDQNGKVISQYSY